MGPDVAAEFEKFHRSILLTQTQVDRIESARSALEEHLRKRLELSHDQIQLQGSYANGTAIKPVAGGEYDVDIIVMCASQGDSADGALNRLSDALADNGNYTDRIKKKNPCVRVEYADDHIGGFHVDLVPVRPRSDAIAPLDAPRRGDGWHPTAPGEYTFWCANRGDAYQRTVRMLKRWRDEQQDVRHGIKSIVLQVLVAENLGTSSDDAERLTQTLSSLHESLSAHARPPIVLNPVLPGENLTARWDQESFEDFKKAIGIAAEVSAAALTAPDKAEACESWRTLLGNAFPEVITHGISVMAVADTSHAQTFAEKGWYEIPDERFQLSLSCYEGRSTSKMKSYPSDSRLLFAGKKLRFHTEVVGPFKPEVWWRVTNTGRHARDKDSLRGEFQKARNLNHGPSADPMTHWESTAYTGSHIVEAFAVLGDRVVARSNAVIVKIHKAGISWAW